MAESVKIIEHGFVITCDAQRRVGSYALLLKDDRISELNTSSEGFKARFPQAEVVDASEKVILPGFIDPHYHGESFVLRNWTAGVPLAKWEKHAFIRKAFSFVYREASKEDLVLAYRSAYFAALKSGITCLSEFCFDHLDAPFAAAREAMKRSDLKGFIGIHNGEQIDLARSQSFRSFRHAFVLPGEENLTTYNLQTTLRFVEETKWPMIAHVAETRRGQEAVRRNFQTSIVRVLEEYRVFDRPLQLTHLACLEEGEEEILARHGLPVIVNPASLLAKNADLPPLKSFFTRGIPIALASDWGVPDPFANLRALMVVLKLAGMEEAVDPLSLIAMHTIHAARALGVHDHTGSLEPGKKADLTLLDLADLRLQVPLRMNLKAGLHNLLQHGSAANVSDVMINGEFFVRRGQVMTYAEEDLKRDHHEIIDRIAARTGLPAAEETERESVSSMTPIIPLPQPNQQQDVEKETESFDEGFRVIGKTGSITEATPPRRGEEDKEKSELPKTARKIFGDDDY